MRFALLAAALSIAPLTLGCMAASKAAPPPPPPPPGGGSGTGNAISGTGREVESPTKATTKTEESDEASTVGNLWGDSIGDAEAEGGLGLTGSGSGGGGTGLGGIGTLGHGAGTGTGQGYGSGSGSTAGKKGRIAAATATTTGAGLPPEVISRIVRANVTQIQACYEKAMTKNPSLAGKVAVKFVIDAQGAVSTASAADTNIADADMVSCVVGAVKKMAFPTPDGGSPVVVTYPFNFSTND